MSSVRNEIGSIYDKVLVLLQQMPQLRDSDKKLCARIWMEILGGKERLKAITAHEFLHIYTNDHSILPSQESIGRARRKIQELYPGLRGEHWEKRQGEQDNFKDL